MFVFVDSLFSSSESREARTSLRLFSFRSPTRPNGIALNSTHYSAEISYSPTHTSVWVNHHGDSPLVVNTSGNSPEIAIQSSHVGAVSYLLIAKRLDVTRHSFSLRTIHRHDGQRTIFRGKASPSEPEPEPSHTQCICMNRLPVLLLCIKPSQSLRSFALVSRFRHPQLCRRFTSLESAAPSTSIMIPSPPLQYTLNPAPFDLDELNQQTVEAEDQRQKGYDLSRKIHVALVQARRAVERNEPDHDVFAQLDAYASDVVQQQSKDREPRLANLSHRMEEIARVKSFQYFLQTGQLISPSALLTTDEEYLAGACMGLAQDLQRYGLGRATARDVDSVKTACDLVRALLDYLLGFDFRNGPLRRKYDGTKYSLKALETLLYELAVTDATRDHEEPETKRPRVDDAAVLPKDELEAIRLRMVHRDELRESLIKKCRDGQKAAKQAIFALHRGDKQRALGLLEECHTCITQQLLPIVDEEPPLRMGSFSNVLEEYVEAKLFACWLFGPDQQNPTERASGIIMKPQDFNIQVDPDVYLGGLCDLTGEVGRYAVQCGTQRDDDGVKLCLQTNRDIKTSIESMERFPNSISKKLDQNNRSVEKLERMLYEMSLSAAVGRNVQSQIDDMDIADGTNEG